MAEMVQLILIMLTFIIFPVLIDADTPFCPAELITVPCAVIGALPLWFLNASCSVPTEALKIIL
jgi:hypothetical protein